MGDLLAMYGIEAAILTAGEDTFSPLAEGLDNVSESLNEVVQQYFFLSDKGFARNEVTGMAPAFTFTGRRVRGDAAQDYIFDKKYGLGGDRKTQFKLSLAKGGKTETLTCPCTICNVQEFSGATTDNSAISFEMRFNGKPTIA